MLTHADKHLIRSLKKKSERDALNLFPAEGPKVVADLLPAFRCRLIIGDESSLKVLERTESTPERIVTMPNSYDYKSLSNLITARPPIAIFEKPETDPENPAPPSSLSLLLDSIQDPGNMGTIIRTAHWFGIRHIYTSAGTADAYQPKVVQSTMGSLAQVRLHPLNEKGLKVLLENMHKENAPVYGALLQGYPLFETALTPIEKPGLLIMGNEGRGISNSITPYINRAVTIIPAGDNHPDSLNVAIATAIFLAEFSRQSKH
ncbi:23S rRNA (guanosine-2'-O-)-methyltransferase RlmB [Porphyromonas macacae]|uniref:23S rRNA (Guanosine-2'-O-)-methyltransferase RlmB n=1 Tax=Porphyromonas macacae TaxID=28115 RepID=A0A379DLP3_9PORP|nr:RNA methyltransferase [Porphyromonas macacae]SUB78715.1 23S rRNA (guanosine-2'-O-)-methyltransferase RlmB [Porphyromonas macacae]